MEKVFKEVLKFGSVGIAGFIVDTAVLYVFKDTFGLYYSRLLSFLLAVSTTWVLNRTITFSELKTHHGNLWLEFFHYFSLMSLGGVINIATYSSAITSSQFIESYPVIGIAIGSLAGMSFNFITSKIFIYREKK